MRPLRSIALMSLLFVALDLLFLRWVWIHWENWGFWDWDYQQTLLETARLSWLEHGQLPLWNPYIGGGATLAGNTLNHAWSPCFLLVLLFGTLGGIKICLLVYAVLGQVGMFLYARALDLSRTGAFLAALLYIAGGVYAQRLTHGHFEWIAIAWIPFVMWMLHKNQNRFHLKTIALGGLFLAFIFLDGGPYQFAFFGVFVGFYTVLQTFRLKSMVPLGALTAVFFLGAGLAAVKLIPAYETVTKYPREVREDNFYGAPFRPTPAEVLHQSFLARDQEHRPESWMPYNLNVGCYTGWIPILLALLAVGSQFRKRWPLIVCALFFLWIMLGSVLPWSPWSFLSRQPGLSMLRVPSRFNIYVVFIIALLAGVGVDMLRRRFMNTRATAWLSFLVVAFIAFDLIWVNGNVFRVAFSVPPPAVLQKGPFKNYLHSPYKEVYKKKVLYDTFDNWPSAVFPAVLENRGVIVSFRTIEFPSFAYPFDLPAYQGEAWFQGEQGRVEAVNVTPNRIEVKTNGLGRLLQINQNFDEGWKQEGPSSAPLLNQKGLIGLRLEPGRTEVVLVYRPGSFFWGAGISLIFLVCLLILAFWPEGKRKTIPLRT